MEAIPLKGRVALVTGGAQRIGRAIALALAHAGADVAITYLKSSNHSKILIREIKELGRTAMAVKCDVRDPKSVHSAARKVLGEFGRLDVLVNNAALYETSGFEDITPEEWVAIFETNTRGPFLLARAFLPSLRHHRGRVINLSSLGAARPWTSHAHYCVSKAGLNMLTQVMAKALAPEISVNAVAPGMIETGQGTPSHEAIQIAAKTPMKRNGTPEDVADAVLFFAAATPFITGQVLYVDGGLGLST